MVISGRAMLAVFAAALLAGGCTAGNDQDAVLTPAQWAAEAGPDLNCPGQAAVRPGSPHYYDITGDGTLDTVADMICGGTDSVTAPDQIEVFTGRGKPERSSRIARLTSIAVEPAGRVFLAHGCIYFTGNKIVIIGHMLGGTAPDGPANILIAQVATWTNGKLAPGKPTPVTDAATVPPGCT